VQQDQWNWLLLQEEAAPGRHWLAASTALLLLLPLLGLEALEVQSAAAAAIRDLLSS
jgi:hypothetical protein